MASFEELLESVQNFDTAQLNDLNNVASWPTAIKVIIWVVVFVGAIAAGYFAHITGLQGDLQKVVQDEVNLRADYESKYFEAAHLEDYRRQQREMEESFEAILRQLPGDTEIPGLIEDITLVGLENGLTFSSIALQSEVAQEFYIEKPIQIKVSGSYHDLGAFVSDVADLSRIVTLHDFTISKVSGKAGDGGGLLQMDILAKTYRYNDERGPS
ncbi:MAG: type 4a pilus biogenesis protein PilO [Pseudomonadota bacterium]